MTKLVLEPAHPLERPALPLGHHFVESGELLIEGFVVAGKHLGELADLATKTHVEMVVATLQPTLIVKQAGQGVASGEGGLLIEGIGVDHRLRHHHQAASQLDAGQPQVDLLLDALGRESPPLAVAAPLLKITEIALQQQVDGIGHVGREVARLQFGKRAGFPHPQCGAVGPVDMMVADVINPDWGMQHIHPVQ